MWDHLPIDEFDNFRKRTWIKLMGTTVMQIELEALENINDINDVISFMGLDSDNMIVRHIIDAVEDLQNRPTLLDFLKEVGSATLYLNLFLDE